MKKILLVIALTAACWPQSSQQVNGNLLPSTTGYDLGSQSQRWDGYLRSLDISGSLTINGQVLTCSGSDCTITGVKGDTGATGPQGPAGANGSDGAAATITVGTVTTGAPGTSVIVTNAGTTSAAVLDFTIPRGTPGQNGAGSGTVTSVAIGNLSPLFTTSVADPTGAASATFSLSTVANGNRVFASPNGSGGAPTFRALVGADLPNPSASTLGGVQSKASETHKFLTQIGTDGAVANAQPALADLSDASNVPTLDASTNTFTGTMVATGYTRADGKLLNKRQLVFMVGSDTGSALADTDDQADIFINRLGQTVTISQIYCKCDAGTPSINLTNGANDILSSNLSCSSSGESSTTFSGTYNQLADDGVLSFKMVTAGGTAKRITVVAVYQ